jgi:hypothetical protein
VRKLLACLLLAACSSNADFTPGTASAGPAADQEGAAIAFARSCVDQNGYEPVWHTALALDRVRATRVRDRDWAVDFPETGTDANGNAVVLGLPQGMMVEVDLDAKTCRQMMLE